MSALIEVKDLKTYFFTPKGVVRAVDGVDFSIEKGKTLGIVGESGCGKSITALSIMGLVQTPPGRIVAGEIIYHHQGRDIHLEQLDPKGRKMRSIRGNNIAMIFQEPMTSLHPFYTLGDQIMESIKLHQGMSKKQAREKAISMLRAVGIPSPESSVDAYPHQLSGGMRQRGMIAMALSCNPDLLIADEPTTALDVTIQAQVLHLMNSIQKEFNMAIQFITHDLGVIARMAHDVAVMYLGRIVEKTSVEELFHNPLHPYTQGLMISVPSLSTSKEDKLIPIKGVVPDPLHIPEGCPFEPRCQHAFELCRNSPPPLVEKTPNHWVACWLHGE